MLTVFITLNKNCWYLYKLSTILSLSSYIIIIINGVSLGDEAHESLRVIILSEEKGTDPKGLKHLQG